MAYYTDAHIAGTLGGAWYQLNEAQQAHYIAQFRAQQAGDAFYAANPELLTAAVQATLTPAEKQQVAVLAQTYGSAYAPAASSSSTPALAAPGKSTLLVGAVLVGIVLLVAVSR